MLERGEREGMINVGKRGEMPWRRQTEELQL
jgi:hypothetical protein